MIRIALSEIASIVEGELLGDDVLVTNVPPPTPPFTIVMVPELAPYVRRT